ncbi:lipoyl domain-containing protein [Microvirga sp. TS319]|uniref:lipoyl domain-containing protein n=1 Tax=Microvirga sp. TS319 TaxID=3241165 RepID=UPI003519E2F0
MRFPIFMPKFGPTMQGGTVVEWAKRAGDYVLEGELLLMVETDKVTTEMSAPASGFLQPIAEPDTTHAIGAIIGYLHDTQVNSRPSGSSPTS